MAYFSERSKQRLKECHPDLQRLFFEVIKHFDVRILCGHRGREEQNRLLAEGRSQVAFPNSYHNAVPSDAVDVAPCPIDWNDRERFTLMAGVVIGIASQMKIDIIWGGDWDDDTKVDDNSFDDLPHFQLVRD